MHRFLPLMFATAALWLPSMAWAQKVGVDYDHDADFTKYKTYKWVTVGNPDTNQLVAQRIVAAIDSQLAGKGLTKADDNPDLFVDYQASVKNQVQFNTFSSGTGPGYGWGPGYRYGWGAAGVASMGTSTTTSSTIPVGTLVVDLNDPQRKQLVFRGIATDTLSDKAEKNTKKIDNAVKKLFEKYPPKAKK